MSATAPVGDQGGSQYPLRIGLLPIGLEGGALRAFKYLVSALNSQQSAFEFEFLQAPGHPLVDMLQCKRSIDRSEAHSLLASFRKAFSDHFIEWCRGFDIDDSLPHKLLILSAARFEDNFFSTYDSETAILALGNWKRYMAPPSILEFFLALSIRYAIALSSPAIAGARHLGTKGCFWDSTPILSDVRYKVLSGFVCAECQARLEEDSLPIKSSELSNILSGGWLGSAEGSTTHSAIAKKLGYDLFRTKGLKPTYWEKIASTVTEEAPKQILKIVGSIILTLILLWLGWKAAG